MNETEWWACTHPYTMLQFLGEKVSERKVRLFAVTCCRGIWHLLPYAESRTAVEVAERWADGLISGEDLESARSAYTKAQGDRFEQNLPLLGQVAMMAAWCVLQPGGASDAAREARLAAVMERVGSIAYPKLALHLHLRGTAEEKESVRAAEEDQGRRQCDLLREIVGNPFRPAAVDPAWLAWNDNTVPKLADVIYHDRNFGLMPVLADALEDAGCTNADLPAHCRAPAQHVRG